ncbi:MarR family winged helix-turn-helix transcriptional regulator [Myceligenerans crystallogenes]|uniref:HTH marR-type domain-containing protein n=1 Tax=Myceligenerans crystallogenes TaxID=316335 RepID=A0ABN2NH80_9MICO
MTGGGRAAGVTDLPTDLPDETMVAAEQQIGLLFRTAMQRWKEQAASIHPDLAPKAFAVLRTLVDDGPAQARDLVTRLGTDKSVLSRQITSLERLGLIEREVDEHDARARRLVATPAAAARVTRVRAARHDDVRRRLAAWTREERAVFVDLLGRLTAPDDA